MMAIQEPVRVTDVQGTAVPVEGNDIDTDRIIPARYLKEITFTNMGKYAFFDERFDEQGHAKKHPFNDQKYWGASILIVNKNFGCGSSREHAPQALMRFGIKAIVGESFAEIFSGNCTVLGVPTVTVSEKDVAWIMQTVRAEPQTQLSLSLSTRQLTCGRTSIAVGMSDVIRKALTEGTWDSTQLMLANLDKIRQTAARLPYVANFRSGA